MENKLSYLNFGEAKYSGAADDYVRFTMQHQLLSRDTWAKFVKVFTEDSDDEDRGWRCEYWGKMMRGACLTYIYNKDEELYSVLTEAVIGLLDVQREDGRFSTYSSENQLDGWDIWGRKYVLTGMLHYYRICSDESLKERIITALCRHADALMARIGRASEGKKEITVATRNWLGVNSASILEPFVDLYTTTGNKSYLDFAEYIIETGGINHPEDLIELALAGERMPYQYPEVKAYETMSFFEGVLAYYGVTGEEKYLQATLKFVEAVNDTDITVIGSSGCTHELFDNSAVKQIAESNIIMQETCVTVTWMRLLARLHLLTGERKYFDRIERSAYNGLWGSVNTKLIPAVKLNRYDRTSEVFEDILPFDSYSPLYNSKRGSGIGGYKRFRFGGCYGCCACIAAAGIALFPLVSVLRCESGLVINTYNSGEIETVTPLGAALKLSCSSKYPKRLDFKIALSLAQSEEFELRIRMPEFVKRVKVTVNGTEISEKAPISAGYVCLSRAWKDGDQINFHGEMELTTVTVGERTAFTYGPVTLARDLMKDDTATSLDEQIRIRQNSCGIISDILEPKEGELIRIKVTREDGKPPMLLTDYASAGKDWLSENSNITAWFNIVK